MISASQMTCGRFLVVFVHVYTVKLHRSRVMFLIKYNIVYYFIVPYLLYEQNHSKNDA